MLAVDQLLNAPLCILGFYYAYSLSAALFGAAPHAGAAALLRATNGEVRAKFVETCVKNWQARRAGDRSRNAHPRLSLSLSPPPYTRGRCGCCRSFSILRWCRRDCDWSAQTSWR